MLQPDFNPAPIAVRIHRCRYISQCKVRQFLDLRGRTRTPKG